MAATLSDSADLASNPTFVRKIRVAMMTAALAVGQETSDLTLDYYRLRRALAANVLSPTNPEGWTTQFCWAVASVTTITDGSSDSDIQFYVNANWASIAGAGPAPTP